MKKLTVLIVGMFLVLSTLAFSGCAKKAAAPAPKAPVAPKVVKAPKAPKKVVKKTAKKTTAKKTAMVAKKTVTAKKK